MAEREQPPADWQAEYFARLTAEAEPTESAEAGEAGARAAERREVSPEAREAMAAAQQERAGLFRRVMTSEITSTLMNLVPVAGGVKMTIEAGYGQTLDEKALSGRERLIHGAVGLGTAALDTLGGVSRVARGAKNAGKSVSALQYLAGMLKGGGSENSARLLAVTVDLMNRNPAVVEAAERAADYLAEQRAKLAAARAETRTAGEETDI